ncbi:DUF3427 domain-containing protein [Echinicola jeungdonensis]|uniref:DUF3427 domain-containing protein n=1 Tax=Echinicola jeungdonensis TaxID=709343 RepID=A0ABV5J533_9BACT|nr:DEAD/DEAH box helicase [Echinicola jeungdonensis]MDN3670712.1 DUF3427 domain-containing protein [Echinicola jeungdonensis]
MKEGIYESIITQLIKSKLEELNKDKYHIKTVSIDKEEAANLLANYLYEIVKKALSLYKHDHGLEKQLSLTNKLIFLIRDELDQVNFEGDLIATEGKMLKAIISKLNADFTDLDKHLAEITPYSRLIYSELFTGGNARLSLDGELNKEIYSSDQIDLLVSFIKWSGLRLILPALKRFTKRGGKLRVITTTYVGATDYKAIQELASLTNTIVKVSYNTGNERVHAKAYLFHRNTGFHTGYIGSSNFSRSALTNGLEWNIKITTKEVPHIIDKFQKTFDTYWKSPDFELYDAQRESDGERLKVALNAGKFNPRNDNEITSYFDIRPYKFQEEILEQLQVERQTHLRFKNLVVAATGTGKTVISAFDFKLFRKDNPKARLLFVAHRKEILFKSRQTFRGILKDQNFGELWVDGIEPDDRKQLFASVQTLNPQLDNWRIPANYYDFIIIDEVHHIAAKSYRAILNKFSPKILLGLTATPERMDGTDILEDFCNRVAAEIRLPEAINKKLICPFQYFGISDSVDLTTLNWRGKYLPSELSKVYTGNDQRVGHIIQNLEKYLTDFHDVQALGFCVTKEHAKFMAEKFNLAGLKSDYLVSGQNGNRSTITHHLEKKEINYLFVVDIFNEGVDIPQIDTVLFLRPTESLTIFLQQLGRGLRLHEDKECLTVLDFVGNARPEYDFEGKFRALVGKTNTSIKKEIEDDFPHVPLGSAIVLEKKAKTTILNNIKAATNLKRNQIIQKIRDFEHQSTLSLTLENFLKFHHIPLAVMYKRGSWKRLCQEAGKIENFESINEKHLISCVSKKWLSTSSPTYFRFILKLARKNFELDLTQLSHNEQKMCLMLHYDFWQQPGGFDSLEESIRAIGRNSVLIEEIIEVLSFMEGEVSFLEIEPNLPYEQPLKLHARYTREQILIAFGKSTFNKKDSNREGVAENKSLNTELLFIDLVKSEENFSPTTLYDDYALSETLFHWQSQNSARPDKGKGLAYVEHLQKGKKILLFIREQAKDAYNNTMGYVFVGKGNLEEYYGAKPMNIKWKLEEPIPPYLWNASAKMSVG